MTTTAPTTPTAKRHPRLQALYRSRERATLQMIVLEADLKDAKPIILNGKWVYRERAEDVYNALRDSTITVAGKIDLLRVECEGADYYTASALAAFFCIITMDDLKNIIDEVNAKSDSASWYNVFAQIVMSARVTTENNILWGRVLYFLANPDQPVAKARG